MTRRLSSALPIVLLLAALPGAAGQSPAGPPFRLESFGEYVNSVVGPVALVKAAAGAGIGQALDNPEEWGQGAGGYGKRAANSLAYNGVRRSLTYGMSLALREDNRYVRSTRRGAGLRLLHALTGTFTARGQDGATRVSISGIGGVVGASLISRAWSPPGWQGAGNAATTAAFTFGATAGRNLLREFKPGLPRFFRRKK